jgi:hypothetical protein
MANVAVLTFARTCCYHLQCQFGSRVRRSAWMKEMCQLQALQLTHASVFPETLTQTYSPTCHHISQDFNLQPRRYYYYCPEFFLRTVFSVRFRLSGLQRFRPKLRCHSGQNSPPDAAYEDELTAGVGPEGHGGSMP